MAVVLKYDSSISAGDRVSDGIIDRKYLIGAASDVDAYTELIAHADCPDSITVLITAIDEMKAEFAGYRKEERERPGLK